MARIEWSRLGGDEVEEVLAILVCRRHPKAERIRPSRGDGGIDILLQDDDGSFTVLQIKKFSSNLSSSQKKQIEKSFTRLVTYAAERDMTITEWSLVTPLDRTNENKTWFEGVTAVVDFKVSWHGLPYVEGLAAEYPDVIDYYLRDGKDRLQSAIAELSSLLRMRSQIEKSDDAYGPRDAFNSLSSLHRLLNSQDPHFRYDFDVSSIHQESPLSGLPGLVGTVREGDGDSFVTVKIFSKFDDAVNVRPIPFSFKVLLRENPEAEQAVNNFHDFGTQATFPVEDVVIDLPGGLGGAFAKGDLTIGLPPQTGTVYRELSFEIWTPDGVKVASADLGMHTATTGAIGAELHGSEEGGVFELTLRTEHPNHLSLANVRPNPLAGKRLESVLPGLEFLANFEAPNLLKIIDPYTGERVGYVELGDGTMAPIALDLAATVRSLLVIQERVGRRVPVPDFEQTLIRDVKDWSQAARLIQGEELEVSWGPLSISIIPGSESELIDRFPGAILLRHPLIVAVSGETYELGLCQFWSPAADLRRTDGEVAINGGTVYVDPVDGAKARLRMIEPESMGELGPVA
ncbi:hypothetical protein ACFCXH_17525 [Streptomyces nojiriensis]|uniref:hypothetical protein n=1 Tax=Streptomyces nojiriensis TaxID=66374 RepID=UPI0035D64DA5